VDTTLGDGIATADLGGVCSTQEMGDAILARITRAR
jgi:isocitrate/isopropylmalate dehydrogenase